MLFANETILRPTLRSANINAFAPSVPEQRAFGPTPPKLEGLATRLATAVVPPLDYDRKIAYLLSVVSAWAYADGQTLANKLEHYGFPGNTVVQIPIVNDALLVVATAFFLRSNDGRVGVLAFRGTEPSNFINWLTDANTVMRPFHYGSVHAGFFDNVEALWDGIAEIIDEAMQGKTVRPPDGNGQTQNVEPLQVLYITGHSLGAAMAVVAAARIFSPDYQAWQPLVRGVYTYGQPMVGDAEFARKYGERFGSFLYRHVYRHDVVPRLPPRTVDGYVHFGEERFAHEPGDIWVSSSALHAKQCMFVLATTGIAVASFFTRRLHLFRRLDLPYSMDDHSPARYVEVSQHSL